MKCKKEYWVMIFLISIFIVITPGCSPQNQTNPTPEPPDNSIGKSPVKIYYGPNDSHGTSWVRYAPDGTLGIVYREKGIGNSSAASVTSADEGLIYKTVRVDGSENLETVTTGSHLEKSVLVYDSDSTPIIFLTGSENSTEVIYRFRKDSSNQWQKETIVDFPANIKNLFIYEISAQIDSDNAVHLLVLITPDNPDSRAYYNAYRNSQLFYITDKSGVWAKESISSHDTLYTLDEYVKTLRRQSLAVDNDGYAHIAFGVQMDDNYHSTMRYGTNRTGQWVIETALDQPGTRKEMGWSPSISLDESGTPAIASTVLAHVPTGSADDAQLLYSQRLGDGTWQSAVAANSDDGYHGSDGHDYTGGIPHLVFDSQNRPHIIFSDVASSHSRQTGRNFLNLGNIRYAVFNGSSWDISTIYRQPSPTDFVDAVEMMGMCLVMSANGQHIRVVGQELVSTTKTSFNFSLVQVVIKD